MYFSLKTIQYCNLKVFTHFILTVKMILYFYPFLVLKSLPPSFLLPFCYIILPDQNVAACWFSVAFSVPVHHLHHVIWPGYQSLRPHHSQGRYVHQNPRHSTHTPRMHYSQPFCKVTRVLCYSTIGNQKHLIYFRMDIFFSPILTM